MPNVVDRMIAVFPVSNIAIFGGAVVPLLTGLIADTSGSLAFALVLPAICYAIIGGSDSTPAARHKGARGTPNVANPKAPD